MAASNAASSISVTGKISLDRICAGLISCSPRQTFHSERSCTIVRVLHDAIAFVVLTLSRKKCDDGTIFLGDGSLAAAPSSRVTNKGIHPVIKVVDDKCL